MASSSSRKRAESSDLMTTKEAAAYLRIHPTTLSNMRLEGGGPLFSKAKGVGIRYHKDDLLAYINKSKVRCMTLPKPPEG